MNNTMATRTISCYLSNEEGMGSVVVHEREHLTSGNCACGAYQEDENGKQSFSREYHYSAELALEAGGLDSFRLAVDCA